MLDFLVADLTAFAPVEDLGRLPGTPLVLANLFGRELVDAIKPPRALRGMKTQSGILAGADQQNRALRNASKTSAVTKTPVPGQDQNLVRSSGGIQILAQLLAHLDKTVR